MINMPRFTIIATVRNEVATIRGFVESLFTQNYQPDEILIVDGASTDGTREILEDYAARGMLRVISQPCNIAEGRNLGIAAARGTHLAVTDAGCRVDQDWLAQIARCFDSECRPDVVAGNFRFETHTHFEEAVVRATFQPNRDNTDTARYYPSSRSVAFTKAAWEKAGGYPEWLYAAEDTLFNIRMRQLGHRFVFCRDAIVRWRPRETWRALAKQRINFARGNARVGIGTAGYLTNLRIHGEIVIALCAGVIHPLFILIALGLFGWHVRHHLWPQVIATTPSREWLMRLRVLSVMEFVRVVSLYGALLGFLDRQRDPTYVQRQVAYMGVSSVDDLNVDGTHPPPHFRRKPFKLQADRDAIYVVLVAAMAAISGTAAWIFAGHDRWLGIVPTAAVAAVGTLVLLAKSLMDFTQTGPRIREEILTHYRRYTLFALARLSVWAFAIMMFTGGAGVLLYYMAMVTLGGQWSEIVAVFSAMLGVLLSVKLQFIRKLRFNPGLLVASMHYRMSRFYSLWQMMTPERIILLQYTMGVVVLMLALSTSWQLYSQNQGGAMTALWGAVLFCAGMMTWATWSPEARPVRRPIKRAAGSPPNILMIGSDTLRADRLGAMGYRRKLTPNIDGLAEQGALFTNCYVPCARTAPSLVSLLTGTWPHTHGIRDNFVADGEARLKVDALPQLLKPLGYRTAAISDWCGADMGKFSFGFDYTDLPDDQWNLKYLIRQGPKDLRLFLSLFVHNRLGRLFLPELYYLGGVPLTQPMGRRARRLVSQLAEDVQPFFLNLFYSTTHPPFASEWPWYTRYADAAYTGESKFAMARLTDPFDIIKRQGAPKEEFDLDQIIDLYDGCVAEFDDEVGRMLRHLEACGLAENTIVVVYSDHGMEFFEHDTWGQGNSVVGDFSSRIPLVIHDPRKPACSRIEQVVRSIDLAPTLLELVGLARPQGMDGISLAACLKHQGECPQLDAFNETGIWIADIPGLPDGHLRYPDLLELMEVPDRESGTLAIKPQYHDPILAAKDRMIRQGCWKLVYQPLQEGSLVCLYDLENDPECRNDLFEKNPEKVRVLQEALMNWISHHTMPRR